MDKDLHHPGDFVLSEELNMLEGETQTQLTFGHRAPEPSFAYH